MSAEILSEWNRQVLEFAEAEDGLLTLKGVRTLAMMHISMHDALSAIERRNLPYIYDVSAPDADPLAATVQAAFTVVSDQYPDLFGAGWATARPFALTSPDQFRSPPPPDIASAWYTEAFNEVKAVGRYESNSRSADQTHLAFWWKDFAENSHNRLARELVAKERGRPFSGEMEMQPPTREYASPSDAAMECAMSRLYLGIHFRYDSIEGNRLGTRIGQYVRDNFLRPARDRVQ